LTENNHFSKKEGVWIGRIPFGSFLGRTVALSTTLPGLDGYHWAVRVSGITYELRWKGGVSVIEKFDLVNYKYEWKRIYGLEQKKEEEDLQDWLDAYPREFNMFTQNCQHFSLKFAKFACENSRAKVLIMTQVPNTFF
jgi:hypothetical protein